MDPEAVDSSTPVGSRFFVVVVLIAGKNSKVCENPARGSARQGTHGPQSNVSLMQHQGPPQLTRVDTQDVLSHPGPTALQ